MGLREQMGRVLARMDVRWRYIVVMGLSWIYGVLWIWAVGWVWGARLRVGLLVIVPLVALMAVVPTSSDLFLSYRRFVREEQERAGRSTQAKPPTGAD